MAFLGRFFSFRGIAAGLFLGIMACCLAATSPAYAINIDGNFSEWSASQMLGTDLPGDVSDGDPVDWVGLWAAFENNSLFLSYQTRSNIDFVGNSWRYAVFIDVDSRAETGYRGFSGGALVGAEYLIEGGTVYRYGGDGTNWNWNMVGNSVYAFNGPRLEMSIPGNIIGMTGASRIRILLAGNNPTTVDYARQDRAGFSFPRDPIVIDGAFGPEWNAATTIGTDPAGDVPACPGSPSCTGGNIVDWTEFRPLRANGTLYLYYNTVNWFDAGNFWRYAVLIDTDNNTLTGYRGVNGTGGEYLIEGGTLYQYTGTGVNWSWSLVTPLSWGVFVSRLELAVAEQYLALPSTSYTIRFRLVGNNPSTPDLAPNAGAGYLFTPQ